MDERGQLCGGCFRTLDEITRWSVMNNEQKRAVLTACSERQHIPKRPGSSDKSDNIAEGVPGNASDACE